MNQRQTAEKASSFRYILTSFDKGGWADANKSLPIPFDLVTVLTDKDKKISAWWNTHNWEGLHLKNSDQVIKWKRRKYEHFS